MTLSIILSTFNRWHLLKHSLEAYVKYMAEGDELIIVDDGSTDGTTLGVKAFQMDPFTPDIKLITLPPSGWRDCAATINIGLRAAKGEFCIITHPEVIPGPSTLEYFRGTAYTETHYVCAKPYYLTPGQQEFCVAENDFSHNFVTNIAGFWTPQDDYSPSGVQRHLTWESWVFGGLSRSLWREIGGMYESTAWGTVDVTFMERRKRLGIPNHTSQHPSTYVIHQNHDLPVGQFVPTDRDMKKCMSSIPDLSTKELCICNNL